VRVNRLRDADVGAKLRVSGRLRVIYHPESRIGGTTFQAFTEVRVEAAITQFTRATFGERFALNPAAPGYNQPQTTNIPVAAYIGAVRCSEDMPDQFQLFRVVDFGRGPRAYVLAGSLQTNCRLEPTQFRAAIGGVP